MCKLEALGSLVFLKRFLALHRNVLIHSDLRTTFLDRRHGRRKFLRAMPVNFVDGEPLRG